MLTFQLGALHHAVNALLKDFRRILGLLVRKERLNLLINVIGNDLRNLVMHDRVEHVHRDRTQVLTLESFPLLALHEVLALLHIVVQVEVSVELHTFLILSLYPFRRERDFLLIHRSNPPARWRCHHSAADCSPHA